jgi:ADP-ribosylglycohydrolase
MDLSLERYRSKLMGCWLGKSIGGTLGAPYEGRRRTLDVTYYKQDVKNNAPANDDLDIQLLWLVAAERYGAQVDSKVLGEYFLAYVFPNWAEYGASKNNMRMGLPPPFSAAVENPYKDSCGCFIRSEIWACLAPGHPEIATRYAFEDGTVDHASEGLHAELFMAAMESAAFVEDDKRKLVEIGLSYIPEDSGVARGVKSAIEAYDAGMSWEQARIKVMTDVPGTFGLALGDRAMWTKDGIPAGDRGWDAPSNIGITILGWFYGDGDFAKSICTAVNCGEDTDCTAASLGALMGIIAGAENLPAEWRDPIGDAITIGCVNTSEGRIDPPRSIRALAERIIRLAPQFLGRRNCEFIDGFNIKMRDPESLIHKPWDRSAYHIDSMFDLFECSPHTLRDSHVIFTTALEVVDGPKVYPGSAKRFKLTLENLMDYHQWVVVRWILPEGWSVEGGAERAAFLDQRMPGPLRMEFAVRVPETLETSRFEAILEVTSDGHFSKALIPVPLLKIEESPYKV